MCHVRDCRGASRIKSLFKSLHVCNSVHRSGRCNTLGTSGFTLIIWSHYVSLLNDPLTVSDIYISRTSVSVDSSEIAGASLHVAIPWYTHIYGIPFISLYPLLAYAYYVKYDQWLVSEEWTFLACVSLGAGHALSFLITKWHSGARAWITTKKVRQDSFPFSSSSNSYL